MIDAPLALAFASGMVATFNPCGFAMLPAYLSYFLGLDAPSDAAMPSGGSGGKVLRALGVGAVVSGGFVAVFGLAGALFSWFSVSLAESAPWVTIVIGVLLALGGVALLAGWEPAFTLPKLDRNTKGRGFGPMFGFGVSYAVASLGCTLPIFIANVVNTFERSNVVSGLAVFITYGLGMALVLMALTLAVALAREGLVRRMRQGVRYVPRISGALLVITGLYVAYYSWTEIRTNGGDLRADPIADRTNDLSARLQTWVQDVGSVRLGMVIAMALVTAVLVVLLRSEPRRPRRAAPPGSTSATEPGKVTERPLSRRESVDHPI